MVRIIPLGGAGEIGASCTLIDAFGLGVVVDAGVRPKESGSRAYPQFDALGSYGPAPSAVVLTHAHSDHTAGLPLLHRRYPNVPVFGTHPSLRVTLTLLNDSLSIQERDILTVPEYSADDLHSLTRALVPVEYDLPVLVAENERVQIFATWVRAGHILGASMVAFEIYDLQQGGVVKVVFSGDVSVFDQPTVHGTDLERLRGWSPELLILEGTYGAEEHGDRFLEEARFVQRVARVLQRGGRVVVPAFAVGRAQNVMVVLRRAQLDPIPYREALGDPYFEMPKVPIYVDGMCREVADHYNSFRHQLQQDLCTEMRGDRHVFFDQTRQVRAVRSREERLSLAVSTDPFIVVSSSGMVTGGAVVEYIKGIADDPKSAVFMTGYLDEESPGAAMMRMQRRPNGEPGVIRLGDDRVALHCEINQYRMGAHSDAKDMERLVEALRPRTVALVHGDPKRLDALAERLSGYTRQLGAEARVLRAEIMTPLVVEPSSRGMRGSVDAPILYPAAESAWDAEEMVGMPTAGEVDLAGASRAITVGLKYGPGFALTPQEAARTQSMLSIQRPLLQSEIDRTEAELETSLGLYWVKQRLGARTWLFAPSRPAGDSSIRAFRRGVLRKVRNARQFSPSEADLDRMREENLEAGSLALWYDGEGFSPVLLLEEGSGGTFRALTPHGGMMDVNASELWASVMPWSPLSGPSQSYRLDWRYLRTMDDLLAEYSRELASLSLSDGEGRFNRDRVFNRMRNDANRNRLSPMAMGLGTALMAKPERLVEGIPVIHLPRHIGQGRSILTQADYDALYELRDRGYLEIQFEQREGAEVAVVRWSHAVPDRLHAVRRGMAAALGEDVAIWLVEALERSIRLREDRGRGRDRKRKGEGEVPARSA